MKRFATVLLTICMLLTVVAPLSVSAAEETYWYDAASTITQKMGTITFNGSQATFSCDVPYDQGGSLGIAIPVTLNNKEVTVEWKMRMEGAWTTRESMIINTGSHRAYIGYRSNGITCQNKNGTSEVIPCTTGNTMNHFAVQINKDGIAEFFCNGKYRAFDGKSGTS